MYESGDATAVKREVALNARLRSARAVRLLITEPSFATTLSWAVGRGTSRLTSGVALKPLLHGPISAAVAVPLAGGQSSRRRPKSAKMLLLLLLTPSWNLVML